jgi:hypothetical protein
VPLALLTFNLGVEAGQLVFVASRVACETLLADQCVVVAGEFRARRVEDFRAVREEAVRLVRQVLEEAGYTAIFRRLTPATRASPARSTKPDPMRSRGCAPL